MSYVIGVDLGGTKVEALLIDSERNVISRERIPSEPRAGQAKVIENVLAVIEMAAKGRHYEAVGMGTPGTYLPSRDHIYGSPHSPVYEEVGFISGLQSRLSVPLVVENDANCLVLGEYFAGLSDAYSHVLGVILGTGVGSGLILDHKLYRGRLGGAGELGHVSFDIHGRLCECGKRGCPEAYLSGPSLSRRYCDVSGEMIDTRVIYQRYVAGEPQAVRLFQESLELLGVMLGNAVTLLDLDAILLGGGVSNIPLWYSDVVPFLERETFGIPRTVPVFKAKLGDSAGVFGAAFLGLRAIGAMDF